MALKGDYVPGKFDHYTDFMSANVGNWISPFMWKQMLGQQGDCISPIAKSSSLVRASQLLTEKEETLMNSTTGPAILVSGRVKLDNTGELEHIFQIDANGQFDSSPGGEYCLDFQGSGGIIHSNYCFDLFTEICQDCELTDEDMFVFTLPLPAGTENISLRHGSMVLDDVTKSPNSPILLVSTPPDDPTTLQWTASDSDGDELHYLVLYSNDGGTSWSPLAIDISGTSLDTNASHLSGSENAMFRVLASDGLNTTVADTGPVKVTRKPPLAFISIPADEALINYENDDIILLGTGQDFEDGVLNGSSLVWNSDIDGLIGYGSQLYLPAKSLSLGSHMITLTAVDSDGKEASTSVMVNVQDKNSPQVTIITPKENTALQDGVTFQAQASDISGIDKVFFSVREPNGNEGLPIGYEDLAAAYNSATGLWEYTFDTTKLQDGYYVILARATDPYGNEGLSAVVPFSSLNWAEIEMLPSTPNSKAGRAMPVKFTIRVKASVDPAQPFVYNEDLEIRIYRCDNPSCSSRTLMQTSRFGTGSKDYRIDGEMYITNFQTTKTPAQYLVEKWRPSNNFMIGSFTFKTVK